MKISTSILQNSFGKYLKLASEGNTIYIEKKSKACSRIKRYRGGRSILLTGRGGCV